LLSSKKLAVAQNEVADDTAWHTVSIRLYDALAHLVSCPGCWIVADCVATSAGSDQWDALGRLVLLQTVEYWVLVRPRARKTPQLY